MDIKANSIMLLISKALTDNEVSQVEFEKILSEIEKYGKKEDKHNLEFDKMFPSFTYLKNILKLIVSARF